MVSTCKILISTFLDDNWYRNRATGVNCEAIFGKVWLFSWGRKPIINSLEDFLSTEQIEVIKEDGTRYSNLYNRVLDPKSRRKVTWTSVLSKIPKLTIFSAKIDLCSTIGAWFWPVWMAFRDWKLFDFQVCRSNIYRIFLFRQRRAKCRKVHICY